MYTTSSPLVAARSPMPTPGTGQRDPDRDRDRGRATADARYVAQLQQQAALAASRGGYPVDVSGSFGSGSGYGGSGAGYDDGRLLGPSAGWTPDGRGSAGGVGSDRRAAATEGPGSAGVGVPGSAAPDLRGPRRSAEVPTRTPPALGGPPAGYLAERTPYSPPMFPYDAAAASSAPRATSWRHDGAAPEPVGPAQTHRQLQAAQLLQQQVDDSLQRALYPGSPRPQSGAPSSGRYPPTTSPGGPGALAGSSLGPPQYGSYPAGYQMQYSPPGDVEPGGRGSARWSPTSRASSVGAGGPGSGTTTPAREGVHSVSPRAWRGGDAGSEGGPGDGGPPFFGNGHGGGGGGGGGGEEDVVAAVHSGYVQGVSV